MKAASDGSPAEQMGALMGEPSSFSYEKRGYLLEDFHLFHLRDPQGPQIGFHYHDFHKIVVLLSGGGSYIIEGRRFLLQPGDIILVGRGDIHRPEIGSGSPYERVILYLSPDFLRTCTDGSWLPEDLFFGRYGRVLRLSPAGQCRFTDKISALEREITEAPAACALMSRCLLLEALIALYRSASLPHDAPAPPAEPGDEKVLSLLAYLNDHIADEINIDLLADHFYISKYHMMRRFREETGLSIHAYLTDKRLFLARDLMSRGVSATDSCYQSGFKSYSAFSRAYRKRFGFTPTGRRPDHRTEEVYE